jgi:integrase/recombinase XerD
VTRLREMMLEELQRRNYSTITTRNYLRVVADFAKYFGKSPDKLGPNELRTYQAYLLQDRKLTPGTVVNWVAALRFFFVKTLKRHQFREFLPYPQDRRRLPTVLSREEVSRLINGLNVPSRLLIFPGEAHAFAKNPWHRKIRYREELRWLEQYVPLGMHFE